MSKVKYGLLIGFVLLVLGGYLLFHWLLQPETVRQYVKDGLAKAWQGKVEVGSASITLPPAIAIGNVALKTADGKKTIVSLGAFELVPSLNALFERKIVISSVNIKEPKVLLEKDAKGELVLTKLLKQEKAKEPSTKEPPKKEEPGKSVVQGITIEAINIKNAIAIVPDGPSGPLQIGPTSGSFSITLSPALALDGGLTVDPIELAPLSIGSARAKVNYKGDKLVAELEVPTISIKNEATGTLILGPLKARAQVNGDGSVAVTPITLKIPPKGSVTVALTMKNERTSVDISAAAIEIGKILEKPLVALKPSPKAEAALTLTKIGGTLHSDKGGPFNLSGWQGVLGNGAKLTASGKVGGGSPHYLALDLTNYELYGLLEGILKEYELGKPIETLALKEASAVAKPGVLALPSLVVAMGSGTSIKGKAALNLEAKGTPFTDESSLEVKVSGTDLFELLKLAPDSKLGGTLGGPLKLSGVPTAPIIDGTLTSPQLTYQYSTTPAVPLETVKVDVGFKEMVVDVPSLTAKLFGGNVIGKGSANLNETPLTFQWELSSVEIHLDKVVEPIPILKDHIGGVLKAQTKGQGVGTAIAGLSAEGSIEADGMSLKNAAGLLVPALTGQKAIVNAVKASLQTMLDTPATKDLTLNKVASAITMKDGAVKVGDINAQGNVGLKTEGIQFKVADGSIGGECTFSVPVKGKSPVAIPLSIGGTLMAPKLKIDASNLKKQFTDEILKVLSGKLTGKSIDTAAISAAKDNAKAQAKETVAKEAAKVEDKLKDKLDSKINDTAKDVDKKLGDKVGKALRGLFR